MKLRPMKKAFALAEIMIVLTIIGVLTAILLPIANHSRPDEAVMKFKKANTTLANVIRELVNSDKYYADGDLGMKRLPNGTSQLVDDPKYLCQTIADNLSTKKVDCKGGESAFLSIGYEAIIDTSAWTESSQKNTPDSVCKIASVKLGEQIVTTDGIVFFDPAPGMHFGIKVKDYFKGRNDPSAESNEARYFGGVANVYGFDRVYKTFCVDIDGIPANATTSDCVNECPFSFGIRADGKMFSGKRADEWMEKGFQKGSNEN